MDGQFSMTSLQSTPHRYSPQLQRNRSFIMAMQQVPRFKVTEERLCVDKQLPPMKEQWPTGKWHYGEDMLRVTHYRKPERYQIDLIDASSMTDCIGDGHSARATTSFHASMPDSTHCIEQNGSVKEHERAHRSKRLFGAVKSSTTAIVPTRFMRLLNIRPRNRSAPRLAAINQETLLDRTRIYFEEWLDYRCVNRSVKSEWRRCLCLEHAQSLYLCGRQSLQEAHHCRLESVVVRISLGQCKRVAVDDTERVLIDVAAQQHQLRGSERLVNRARHWQRVFVRSEREQHDWHRLSQPDDMALIIRRLDNATDIENQTPSLSESPSTVKHERRLFNMKKIKKNNSCQAEQTAGPSSQPQAGSALGQTLSQGLLPTSPHPNVPLLMQHCCRVVERQGLDTVGVYRVPGNSAAVTALIEQLKTTPVGDIDFDKDTRWHEVNVVSSLLKAYLRELSEPILTDKLYPKFIDAIKQSTHESRLTRLKTNIRKLPKVHRDSLAFLTNHLHTVAANAQVNKMRAKNLSLMFGPSIVRSSGDAVHVIVEHMGYQGKLVETFIRYSKWLFDAADSSSMPAEIIEHDEKKAEASTDLESSASGEGTLNQSGTFNDMRDMLDKMQNDTGCNDYQGLRSFFTTRRNSRNNHHQSYQSRSHSSKPTVADISDPIPLSKSQIDAMQSAPSTSVWRGADRSLILDDAGRPIFEERDIDAEINRARSQLNAELSDGADCQQTYEEMREKRQRNLYSARRQFINGANRHSSTIAPDNIADPLVQRSCDDIATCTSSEDGEMTQKTAVSESGMERHSVRRIDSLIRHSRHLNAAGVSPQASSVLSPETQEKIRRMQTNRAIQEIRMREANSNEQIRRFKNEKDKIDKELAQERQENDVQPISVDKLQPPNTHDRNTSPAACSTSSSSGVSTEARHHQQSLSNTHTSMTSTNNKLERQWYSGHESESSAHTLDSQDSACVTTISKNSAQSRIFRRLSALKERDEPASDVTRRKLMHQRRQRRATLTAEIESLTTKVRMFFMESSNKSTPDLRIDSL